MTQSVVYEASQDIGPIVVATRLQFVDILKCLISFKKDILLDPYKVTKH